MRQQQQLNNNNESIQQQNQQRLAKKIKHFIYNPHDMIGSGFSSEVYRGVNENNMQQIAVKVIQLSKIQNQVEKYLLNNQISALRSVKHKNVLNTYDILMTKNNVYIVTQFCEDGDLSKIIQKRKKQNSNKPVIPQWETLNIFKDIVQGYRAIQEKGILHRDLKTANIFLHKGVPKIADFGFCQLLSQISKRPQIAYNVGSPAYMSPQSYKQNHYSPKSDIWSIGIILYEMLMGQTPDKTSTYDIMANNLTSGKITNLINEQLRNILCKCFKRDINARIDSKGLLELVNAQIRRLQKTLTNSMIIDRQNSQQHQNQQQQLTTRFTQQNLQQSLTLPQKSNSQPQTANHFNQIQNQNQINAHHQPGTGKQSSQQPNQHNLQHQNQGQTQYQQAPHLPNQSQNNNPQLIQQMLVQNPHPQINTKHSPSPRFGKQNEQINQQKLKNRFSQNNLPNTKINYQEQQQHNIDNGVPAFSNNNINHETSKKDNNLLSQEQNTNQNMTSMKASIQILLFLYRLLKLVSETPILQAQISKLILFRHRSYIDSNLIANKLDQTYREFQYLKSRFDQTYLQKQLSPKISNPMVNQLNNMVNVSFISLQAINMYKSIIAQACLSCQNYIFGIGTVQQSVIDYTKIGTMWDYLMLEHQILSMLSLNKTCIEIAQALQLHKLVKQQPKRLMHVHYELLKNKNRFLNIQKQNSKTMIQEQNKHTKISSQNDENNNIITHERHSSSASPKKRIFH